MATEKIIKICTGPRCESKNSRDILSAVSALGTQDQIVECSCQGNCQNGPTVIISTPETFKKIHSHMDTKKTEKLLKS